MLQVIPRTISTYEFKNHTGDVSASLKDGPVLLMNRATAQAVLVDPEQWNATAEHIAELEFLNEALSRAADDPSNDIPWETVKAEMIKRGLIDG